MFIRHGGIFFAGLVYTCKMLRRPIGLLTRQITGGAFGGETAIAVRERGGYRDGNGVYHPGIQTSEDIKIATAPAPRESAMVRKLVEEGNRLESMRLFYVPASAGLATLSTVNPLSAGDRLIYNGTAYSIHSLEIWDGFCQVLGIRIDEGIDADIRVTNFDYWTADAGGEHYWVADDMIIGQPFTA